MTTVRSALPTKAVAGLLVALLFISCASAARDTYLFGERQGPGVTSRSLIGTVSPDNISPIHYGVGPEMAGGYGFGSYGNPGFGGVYGSMAMAPMPAVAPAPAPGPGLMYVTEGSDLVRPAPALPMPAI